METQQDQKPPAKGRNWLRTVWGLLPYGILIGICVVIFLMGSKIRSESARLEAEKKARRHHNQPPVNVVTLKLEPSPIRDRIVLPAVVEPWVKLKVLTEVRGKVIRKAVNEGDSVKKGDVIAVLDSRDYQHVYRSAKASYEAAQATLKRLERLQKGQLSTRSQLDDARAQAENYKSALDTAALNVERCTIKAPISGIVNRLYIEEGQFLDPSTEVAEILQMDRVKINVGIPESDVDAVRKIDTFTVYIDALNNRVFTAKKYFLSRTADEMARLYNLKLSLDNPNNEILPDMFARVEIVKKQVNESLAIPLYAVISRNHENLVFVVNDDKAHARPVKLGLQEGWRIEVTEGLSAGDRVIVVGQRGVSEGQNVNVVRQVTDPREIIQ